MPFSSVQFLFLFLPFALLFYFLIPIGRWRNILLLAASLFFYAWGEPVYVLLLLGSILLNWFLGLRIEGARKRSKPGWTRGWVFSGVVVNLLMLMFFKYWGFVASNINAIFDPLLVVEPLPLPLGISFFTFSSISYVLDVYHETVKAQPNLIYLANYIAMFPKLLQGPIARCQQMEADLVNRKVNLVDISEGCRRFVMGLAKKVLLADNIAVVANQVFHANVGLLGADVAWYGLIAYALQIYFDFSGYSDMAIGLGRILGFHLPENFNYPYISRSITDFWRRWHMTLTAWFRNYVFMPLEIARKREKHLRQQSNLVIVFLLTGLWHGASWNFILWGIYFGLILAVEASGLGKRLKRLPRVAQHLYTIFLFLFGWVFFRLEDLHQWVPFFKALFGGNGLTGLENARSLNVLLYLPLVLVAIVGCTPVFPWLGKKLKILPPVKIFADMLLIGLFLLCVVFLVSNGYHAFLYFQF
jgi:alginate O-acetyltransferase complex protein AlgI